MSKSAPEPASGTTPTTASKPPSAPAQKAPSKGRAIVIGVAVLLVALLLSFFSYTATKPGSDQAAGSDAPAPDVSAGPESDARPEPAEQARRDAKDPLAQGKADAPVVLVEYGDFKCSFCGKFARDTEPGLVKKYVDAGTLRIEWRNFPIFGAESEAAARASWAAGRQGRFWQFHEAAYAKGVKEQGFTADRLSALAEQAGVSDLGRFKKDLDSDAATRAVEKDREEAYKLGATSTPSFLINGRPIAGAQPAETFAQLIDEAATAAADNGGGGK